MSEIYGAEHRHFQQAFDTTKLADSLNERIILPKRDSEISAQHGTIPNRENRGCNRPFNGWIMGYQNRNVIS